MAYRNAIMTCVGVYSYRLVMAYRNVITTRVGGRIRAGLMSLMYRKSLRLHSLSIDAVKETPNGKGGGRRVGKGGGRGGGKGKDGGKGKGGRGDGGRGGGKGNTSSMGKVVMLMSADAQKFVDGMQNVATLAVFPFQVKLQILTDSVRCHCA